MLQLMQQQEKMKITALLKDDLESSPLQEQGVYRVQRCLLLTIFQMERQKGREVEPLLDQEFSP
jgi:hypothetical protein